MIEAALSILAVCVVAAVIISILQEMDQDPGPDDLDDGAW